MAATKATGRIRTLRVMSKLRVLVAYIAAAVALRILSLKRHWRTICHITGLPLVACRASIAKAALAQHNYKRN